MDDIDDNTLKQLKQINERKDLNGIERCNEMIETLQYIQENKSVQFSNNNNQF